jgi:hypothetical protein
LHIFPRNIKKLIENFIKFFQKIGKCGRRHVASCKFWEKMVFCKIGKNQNSPLSPLSSHFDSLAKGGSSATRIHGSRGRFLWKQREVFMAAITTLRWAARFHAAIFKQINQVTHQSYFQKTKENFVGCVKILHEEMVFLPSIWHFSALVQV